MIGSSKIEMKTLFLFSNTLFLFSNTLILFQTPEVLCLILAKFPYDITVYINTILELFLCSNSFLKKNFIILGKRNKNNSLLLRKIKFLLNLKAFKINFICQLSDSLFPS